ncbi:MAG: methyltransferase domain-containing protein [Bacteroidota bacterium]|nr:methyltransferase domain-containing protein [Bacteroidota bacterium]
MNFISITIDYETWHPLPDGWVIDWEKDIFTPTERFLDIADRTGIKLTFMVEIGEYFWLSEFEPTIAKRMESQLREIVRRGHDVQLHLHPNWLPELGAKFESGKWYWDWTKSKCEDYPGDLNELIAQCKQTLETILKTENSSYQVTSFRAGTYKVQPFKRLHQALNANGILCDTSVYQGGFSEERGYDFRFAYSDHQPYFANPYDPQLKAPPSESSLVEIPIFTFERDQRWFLDGSEAAKFADRILRYHHKKKSPSSESLRWTKKLKVFFGKLYGLTGPFQPSINRVLPKRLAYFITSYISEKTASNEYFVMIGHTKGEHNFEAIEKNFAKLKREGIFDFVTLSEMTDTAFEELHARIPNTAEEEAVYQVARERNAIMGEERNEAQSYYLQEKIPLDRTRVLDLGCGAGYWSSRIAETYPWMNVVGADIGKEFIEKARSRYATDRVSFEIADFTNLPFEKDTFDCIYADNTLEHAFDVNATLCEAYRVLKTGGLLVAAIPSDARNPKNICDNHTWKTAPHEVMLRLQESGFTDIDIEETDVYRRFGTHPYPPSSDRMMFIRAWKHPKNYTKLDRAIEAMNWVYHHLNPERSSNGRDAVKILAGGFAFCLGYTIALGELLQREGFNVKWITMLAKDIPNGRGKDKTDSHEVIEAEVGEKKFILDPMANTLIPLSLEEILKNPSFAKPKENPDERYVKRNYQMYDTAFWYSRVFRYVKRKKPGKKPALWKSNG